jgi:putative copper export protein
MLLLKKVELSADIEPKVLVLCWGSLINSMTFSGYIGMGAEGTMAKTLLHLHPCALSFVPPVAALLSDE